MNLALLPGSSAEKWVLHPPPFQVEGQIRGVGCVRCTETQNPGRGAFSPKEDVRRSSDGYPVIEGPVLKKRHGPATKRQIAEELVRDHGVPVSRACKLASIPRSQYYYQSAKDDSDIIEWKQQIQP